MKKAFIHQIFYSEETRLALDNGFIPLDNSGQRPDWCEYWPIRNFIGHQEMDDDALYGFLSPKFKSKTGLGASDVHQFLASVDAATDIVAFSPFFDAGAVFTNIFKQGASGQRNAWPVFVESVRLLAPDVDLDTFVTDSRNTIFCNYFLAKPRFWRYWFDKAEMIFNSAEENNSPLGLGLNQTINHTSGPTPIKVFVIERLVSLLLATESRWSVQLFNPMSLPVIYLGADRFGEQLAMLDALKMAAATTGRSEYMTAFATLRAQICR
ncbi:hypothetical protein [Paraburkholderia haematera]|jgi:hypothetical protein|uniref:Uncharacterized protein n=1 Tax=Paraburkholderia haematera TaxID=2793077 RepID=A0ABN7LW60_9BURK|nr:hypothetical protein [Paraburkholderia haematera]CAE6772380.1 hypothetical protein R69888_03927 [Paraburkholderia haematera]